MRPANTKHRSRLWSNPAFVCGLLLMLLGAATLVSSFVDAAAQQGNTLATIGGGWATAGSVLTALGIFLRQSEDATSRFYLEQSSAAIEKAYGLLSDGNNNRDTWVLAARILAQSKALHDLITTPEHKVVLDIYKDDYRARFSNLLKADIRGNAAFFFGSPVYDEPVADAIARQEKNNQLMSIPESALSVVYEFARYADDYAEPLPGEFTTEQLRSMKLVYPSLFTFIAHLRRSPEAHISGVSSWTYDEAEERLLGEIGGR